MNVGDVMTTAVVTARPETTVEEAAELLLYHGISGLPVVDADGCLLGMVSQADLMSKGAFGALPHRPRGVLVDLVPADARWVSKADGRTVADVMSTIAVTAAPADDVQVAARRMLERGVQRLPVVEEGRLVGIVSRSDVLRQLQRSDADIAAEIGARLASPWNASEDREVTVSVENGVVTLAGRVRGEGEIPVVRALAESVSGVVEVVDRIGFASGGTRSS